AIKSAPIFTLSDIEKDFDPNTLAKGQSYQEENRVTHVSKGHDKHGNWTLKSTIQGPNKDTYHTDIIINYKDGTFIVDGYCSCPMDHNCKHVAASLLQVISQQ